MYLPNFVIKVGFKTAVFSLPFQINTDTQFACKKGLYHNTVCFEWLDTSDMRAKLKCIT